jgi:anaerobic ribonucleoside-triphosphate reductase activating protein
LNELVPETMSRKKGASVKRIETGLATELFLNVHSRLNSSVANGPGNRSVLWVQGCSIGCDGCFNPSTHNEDVADERVSVTELVNWVLAQSVDGLTISGGEPFQQLAGIAELARAVRLAGLTVIVLTGFTSTQVRALMEEQDLKECFDVVLAGPYRTSMHIAASLRGSRNKEYLFFSDVYSEQDFDTVPVAEVLIEVDGTVLVTGINVPTMK